METKSASPISPLNVILNAAITEGNLYNSGYPQSFAVFAKVTATWSNTITFSNKFQWKLFYKCGNFSLIHGPQQPVFWNDTCVYSCFHKAVKG